MFDICRQTVVEHIGSGVISFQPNGEVELINKAAKKILRMNQLKNIKSLTSFSPKLVDALFHLKPGERALIKINGDGQKIQLAISATEFIMRGLIFTLVAIQDIQSELEKERLTKELEIAHQVQMKLLPKGNPTIPGFDIAGICIPAAEVGGDYYDFIDLQDGKLGIAMADVSGKGVPAAIYMTLTKGVLQSQAEKDISPKDVLQQVNTLMYQSIERGSFVSMFYAVLDAGKNKLICSRAGHDPAIHIHNGNTCSLIQPSGMAIGLEQGAIFDKNLYEQDIELKTGDVIVFYTDGYTEAMNSNYELYGEARLIETIQAHKGKSAIELVNCVSQSVKDFLKEHPQYDDMTMVVVKVI